MRMLFCTRISPLSGMISPLIVLSSVVFPVPFCPTMPICSPLNNSKEELRYSTLSPKECVKLIASINAMLDSFNLLGMKKQAYPCTPVQSLHRCATFHNSIAYFECGCKCGRKRLNLMISKLFRYSKENNRTHKVVSAIMNPNFTFGGCGGWI